MRNFLPYILVGLVAALPLGSAAWAEILTESPDGPEHIKEYLTLNQALDKVFPQADSLWTETWAPDDEILHEMELALGWRLDATEFNFHRASRKGKDLGTAVVTNEKGRFKPITFMVKIDPDGNVGSVQVMVYRESRGDGVKRQRFLKQFRGKNGESPLRMNRDITVLSGATLSSRAVTAGVKRVLLLVERRYGFDR